MRTLLTVVALLTAACAPEMPNVAETSGGEVEVAGAKAEALSTCSDGVYCSKARSTIASYLGGSWSWGSPCSAQSWQATGSGGRTLVANRSSGTSLYSHAVFASQTDTFYNICSCNSNGSTASCSNNP